MSARILISGLLAVLAGTAATVCTASEQCAVCKPCKALIYKVLRQVVDSTAGDVVQLVRTLPRRWLESHTVTADRFYPALFACFLGLFAVHSS
jgi:hypothetical protein